MTDAASHWKGSASVLVPWSGVERCDVCGCHQKVSISLGVAEVRWAFLGMLDRDKTCNTLGGENILKDCWKINSKLATKE